MKFSAFARFNGGFRFSSRPPNGQIIYESLKASQGDTYEEDFSGRQSARLYAAAMSLAAAQQQVDRAISNANPATATELLGKIEQDYQIVPNYTQSLAERRVVADARRKVTRGARRESVEGALRALLGSDFIAYETTDRAHITKWPAKPGNVGAFRRNGAPKKGFWLDSQISRLNVQTLVPIRAIPGLVMPQAGDLYTVDPDTRCPSIERITITETLEGHIVARFKKPHAIGALAISPHPVWISNQRHSRIIVTFAAANSPETRRKINELMARMLRGVSQWFVTHNLGSFVLNDSQRGLMDRTVLG